jgi:uncharacterized protein YprB with RNaseH-like and TPR domain/predicted nuclease with RNAse H fold/dephospho-CoA kinase
MLILNTFQHIKGISAKKEIELWRAGVLTWDDLEKRQNLQFSLFDDLASNSIFLSSKQAIDEENADFFSQQLSPREFYRIALSFPYKTLFLDIETTGLSKYYDKITLVGWCMGKDYGVYIQGDSDEPLRKALEKASIIVTFNGSLFDIPFLRQKMPELKIPQCHVDLRFLSKRVGLSGGQKVIESTLGIKRKKNVANVIGETAPLLWYKYCWGDQEALKQLISYNHADIEGMKIIFDEAVKRLLKKNQVPPAINRAVKQFSKKKSKIKWTNGSPECDGIKLRPYKGNAGPLIYLSDLEIILQNRDFRVVGIDLTGSERRASGWCLLENEKAETCCLSTDDEIINETVRCKPKLVSIDSPLTIPFGRQSVHDDDPGRDTYGIMRQCERILKKRGVNVYPSLIPSMQQLTARGIRLANHFRSLGIPVIESYPGAAQDIMGIPRKRASLEYLSRGLELFGIKGNFISTPVNHDELDAITSAVVGLFFWSGKYEALGTEEEDYLIIPDLQIDAKPWKARKVIGLSGHISAGKTTAAKFIESLGFAYGSYSDVLKKMLNDKGVESTRAALQEIGAKVNKAPGQRWLCKQLKKMLPMHGNIVIDGLRHPEDHAFMVETYGPAFVHVYIDASEENRMQRYIDCGSTKHEFLEATEHNVEANVSNISLLAHHIVHNDKGITSFEAAIIKLVHSIIQNGQEYSVCL